LIPQDPTTDDGKNTFLPKLAIEIECVLEEGFKDFIRKQAP